METLEQKYAFNEAYLTAIKGCGVYIPYLHFQKGYELAKEVYTNLAEIENLINEALDYEIYDLNNKEDGELKSYIDRMQSDGFIFALFEELHARANQFLIKAKIQKELNSFSYQSDGLTLWLEEESKEELKTELNEIENKLKKVNLRLYNECENYKAFKYLSNFIKEE
ncbi:hypothetical protein [Campylobacter upsaliensis]|uniref:Uncharacterized protein n=1 Tax=Campylobacter upsaliensis TaxID=28080 RepID=A0A381EGZ5_CAMUP|nr:hypothetical protein [Campylobacter upsaliensis]SUX26183.1 Uncharacterised protein [Campylobacter upsaliensis]